MKKRNLATAYRLTEVPRPLDIGTEVLYALDARRKLQAAIESENQKRYAAEIESTGVVVKEINGWPVVNVDVVRQRDVAAKSAAERFKKRIEALKSTLARVNQRIEQLKCDYTDAFNAAVTRRIAALEKTLSEKEGAEKDLEDQIRLLKAEIVKPKAQAKKAG
jgi:hypothetical protein